MPAQLIPTPIIKGEKAKEIYSEACQNRRREAEKGAELLKRKFEKKFKERE